MYSIVIVEDEELIARGLQFAFDWSKHDCIVAGTARNGVEGMELIAKSSPQIVLADISMPVMNGLEMIDKAKAAGLVFAALIITGHDEFGLAKKAIGLGVVDYLLKPVDHRALAIAIEKCKMQLEQIRLYEHARRRPSIESSMVPKIATNSRIVQEIISFVEDQYSGHVGIQEIADQLGVSYSTITKHFKEELGITLNEYINRVRITKAIDLMRSGRDTIYMIADQVGFTDYKYFIKVFGKYTGVSPYQFAKNIGLILSNVPSLGGEDFQDTEKAP